MCGIAGIYRKKGECTEEDRASLGRMLRHMHLRGPDDSAISQPDKHILLGANRLAITDHKNPLANQPFTSQSGQSSIVWNGEIYNHRELRKELTQTDFKTNCDTETLLEYWETFHTNTFEHIEGMFALALYTKRTKELILGVDPSRQKPLYYADLEDVFLFASSLDALLQTGYADWSIDPIGISQVIATRFALGQYTHVKQIREMRPGSLLHLTLQSKALEDSYFTFPQEDQRSEQDTIELLRDTLLRSITECLDAELPVSVFLSGGVDSSLVAAIAHRQGIPIRTYSIGFEPMSGTFSSRDQIFDEFEYSRQIAEKCGSLHKEYRLSIDDYFSLFDEWLEYGDEAFSALESVCLLSLYKEVAQDGLKITLTGTGVDEIFEGYRYGDQMQAQTRDTLPAAYYDTFGWTHKADLTKLSPDLHQEGRGHGIEELTKLLSPYLSENRSVGNLTQMLNIFLHLGDCEHRQADMASMRSSVEARAPLSSTALLKLGMSIPFELKSKGGESKYIFKKAVEGLLPQEIIWRKKRGFPVPAAYKFSEAFENRLDQTLTPESFLCSTGIINYEYLSQIKTERNDDYRNIFWRLYALEKIITKQKLSY